MTSERSINLLNNFNFVKKTIYRLSGTPLFIICFRYSDISWNNSRLDFKN